MLQHISQHNHIKHFALNRLHPRGCRQIGLNHPRTKRFADGKRTAVHVHASHTASFGMQNPRYRTWAATQLQHPQTRLYHSGNSRCGAATIRVNLMRVFMF